MKRRLTQIVGSLLVISTLLGIGVPTITAQDWRDVKVACVSVSVSDHKETMKKDDCLNSDAFNFILFHGG
jgi:hypothetical protein